MGHGLVNGAASPASRRGRWLCAAGALVAAAGVALSAYAAHGADEAARGLLQTAALQVFGHGIAVAALARPPLALPGPARPALGLMLAGSLVFAAALAWKALAGGSSAAAPFGGGMLLLGWLLYAVAALRA